jgi:hypothetical protein
VFLDASKNKFLLQFAVHQPAVVAIAATTVVAMAATTVALTTVVAMAAAMLMVATMVADGSVVGCAHEFGVCCPEFVAWSRCADASPATRDAIQVATRALVLTLDADATKPRKLTF